MNWSRISFYWGLSTELNEGPSNGVSHLSEMKALCIEDSFLSEMTNLQLLFPFSEKFYISLRWEKTMIGFTFHIDGKHQ